MNYTKAITGPLGKRVVAYAVCSDNGEEIKRFRIREFGYWRNARNAALRFQEESNRTIEESRS